MDYIIFDLEWSRNIRHVIPKCPDEIIQIGAVKYDKNLQYKGSFNRFIKPGVYRSVDAKVAEITGITKEHLERFGVPFNEAFREFKAFMGREYILLSWGPQDVQVLRVNAQYYNKKNYVTMWAPITDSKVHAPENMYPVVMSRREEFPYLTEADVMALARFAQTGTGGGHADWKETALVMHYYPDTVAPDRFTAETGLSTHRAEHLESLGIKCGKFWPSNFPNAYHGYPPLGCSANIGKAMAYLCVERLVKIFKAVKEDEDCVRMAQGLPKLED